MLFGDALDQPGAAKRELAHSESQETVDDAKSWQDIGLFETFDTQRDAATGKDKTWQQQVEA